MGSSGSFPLDLVLFGMIAAFLVLRLRSILGRRTGFERPPEQHVPLPPGQAARMRTDGQGPQVLPPVAPVIDGVATPAAPADTSRPLPDAGSPAGQALLAMRRIDAGLEPAHFLNGAEAAFRIIVTAFAAGDRARLRPLLSDDTWRAFEAAIAAREAAGETQRTEIRSIQSATIEAATLRGTVGRNRGALRLRPGERDPRPRRQPGRRRRRDDRNHRSVDLRAGDDLARSDLAAGGRAQRLMRPSIVAGGCPPAGSPGGACRRRLRPAARGGDRGRRSP